MPLVTSTGSNLVQSRRLRGAKVLPDYVAHGTNAGDVLSVAAAELGSSIPLPAGLSFDYDPSTGDWTGSASIGIPGLPGGGENVSVAIVFHGTSLVSATGTFNGTIPIATGVDLTGAQFSITEDPLTITAGITINALEILTGNGTLTVQPNTPWKVSFTGTLSLDSLVPLASGYFAVGEQSGFAFGGGFAYNFGPVSLSANIQGQFQSATAWYVEGSGSACIVVCVDASAIVSNVGVAGCGSIDLGFTTIGIGVGYTWDDHSLHLLGGACDLSNYVPAFSGSESAQLTTENTADARLLAGRGHITRAQSPDTFTVAANERAVAFSFTGAPGELPPLVTMFEPPAANGTPGRTIDSPQVLGDYSFGDTATDPSTEHAFVEENPVNDTTTFIVADPNPGTWSFSLDQGSPAVIDTDLAETLPPIGKLGSQITRLSNTPKAVIQTATLGQVASASHRLPAFEIPRIRELDLKIPAGSGDVTVVEEGKGDGALLGKFSGSSRRRTKGIAFDPPPPGAGEQKVIAYYLGANDLPRASRVLMTFMPPRLPRIAPVKIIKVLRHRTEAVLLLSGGPLDNLPDAIDFRVATLAGDGINQTFLVTGREVRYLDGHPAIVDHGIPSTVGARFIVWPEYDGTEGPGRRAASEPAVQRGRA